MRLFSILLYFLTLAPIFDVCTSQECDVDAKDLHTVFEISVHDDCCPPVEHSCDLDGHDHSQNSCRGTSVSIVRPERESIRRAPMFVTNMNFEFLYSKSSLRGPPVEYVRENSLFNSYQVKVVSTSVIRC